MREDAWWAEPLDLVELKRRGFTYEDARELERIRQEAIPLHERKAAEASMDVMLDRMRQALNQFGRTLDDVFGPDAEP